MGLDILKQNLIQLTITDNDIPILYNIVDKLIVETKKAGFKKKFNSDEISLINDIKEQLDE